MSLVLLHRRRFLDYEPQLPPEKPTGVTVTNITADSATISWDPAARADSYSLQYLDDAGNWSAFGTGTLDTDYNWSGLREDTLYPIQVNAINEYGEVLSDVYEFRTDPVAINTYIGGVASTIPDKTTLASKITSTDYPVTEADITAFTIVGSDIEACITVDYVIPRSTFRDTGTYFRDLSGKAFRTNEFVWYGNTMVRWVELASTVIGNQNFQDATALTRALFPNATTIEYACFYHATAVERIYMPKAIYLGGSGGGTNQVFSGIKLGCTIYADPSLATSNGGAEDANIAYARNERSANIIYVQNFTKPSAITDLSHSGGTLNFTPPASTNTIDFYEVYVNGLYHSEIAGSGASVSGLVAGDEVEVYACDIYYNRSKSNVITI